MQNTFNAIVNPVIPKRAPAPGETAILVSSESDLVPLKQGLDDENVNPRKLFMSRHYLGDYGGNRISLEHFWRTELPLWLSKKSCLGEKSSCWIPWAN